MSRRKLGPATHRNAGSRLRERFGNAYVSVGLTFHHGAVDTGLGPIEVPVPASDFAGATLDAAGPGPYLLDLRGKRLAPVDAWLSSPAKIRVVGPWYDPADDAAYNMTGGSLGTWFDALVFVRQVTPIRRLSRAEESFASASS